MANPLTEFARKNIAELILGLAVGVVIALLVDLNFQESITVIILGVLVALILNQLLRVFVPNEKNQRTALIVLALIGGFFLIQQFNVGIFSFDNANIQSFAEVEVQPQVSVAILTGIGALVGGIAKLPLLILLVGGIVALLIFFPPVGIAVLLLLGIPALLLIGTGTFLIAKNFTLIIILVAMYGIASLIFKKPIKKAVVSST